MRDAVEKRPPPDEAYDLEYGVPENFDFHNTIGLPFYRGSPNNGFIPFSIPNKYSILQSYINPQGQLLPFPRTLYSPIQVFRNTLGLPNPAPYRSDNINQQLLVPYYNPRAKSLYSKNPFLNDLLLRKENPGMLTIYFIFIISKVYFI